MTYTFSANRKRVAVRGTEFSWFGRFRWAKRNRPADRGQTTISKLDDIGVRNVNASNKEIKQRRVVREQTFDRLVCAYTCVSYVYVAFSRTPANSVPKTDEPTIRYIYIPIPRYTIIMYGSYFYRRYKLREFQYCFRLPQPTYVPYPDTSPEIDFQSTTPLCVYPA